MSTSWNSTHHRDTKLNDIEASTFDISFCCRKKSQEVTQMKEYLQLIFTHVLLPQSPKQIEPSPGDKKCDTFSIRPEFLYRCLLYTQSFPRCHGERRWAILFESSARRDINRKSSGNCGRILDGKWMLHINSLISHRALSQLFD